MVSVLDPAVLLLLAWVIVLFVSAWRYRWGDLPPKRALLVFAAGATWVAFSLTQVQAFLAPPYDDVLVAVAAVCLLAGVALFRRWWRVR